MFIDDIKGFSDITNELLEGIVQKQATYPKLAQRQKVTLEKLNQSIYIRDLILKPFPEFAKISKEFCFGEKVHGNNTYQK